MVDLSRPLSLSERLFVLLRLVLLSTVLVAGVWFFFVWPLGPVSVTLLLVSGLAYALLFIATHEMVHGTLFGCPRIEHGLACTLSWPMAWPHLTYVRLHRLHHRWNGSDPRDPERTTLLPWERVPSGSWSRLIQEHRLVWRLFVLGGLGLIAETNRQAIALETVDRRLRLRRWLDGAGVLIVHATMLGLALRHGVVGRYLLGWFILERVIGIVMQFRGLVEHHDLWFCHQNHLLTQLYASRSVIVPLWLNTLLGGLPHHSAHHAFPCIPSSRLPRATERISAVLAHHQATALPMIQSYWQAIGMLNRAISRQARG